MTSGLTQRRESIPNHRDYKMKAVFLSAAPYAEDALNLPVENVDAAVPYYEKTFGFHCVSRQDNPFRSAILGRDGIQIGLAENGGDPTQEGCFFEVNDVKAAFNEIKGRPPSDSDFRLDKFNDVTYQVFLK
jgi:lactoylglutathione lyase